MTAWWGPGLLTLLWALFYHQILFLHQTFILMDLSRFFYPLWKWGAGVLKEGCLPLWDPDAGFGTPYWADPQMAVTYPPKWVLYHFFTPVTAFNLLITLHHLWALLGFWSFARGRGFASASAFLGSLIFGFSFNAVSLSWAPIMLMAFSWIPWIFWAAENLWKGSRGSWLILTLVVAAQMACGYPVFAYLTVLLLGSEWTFRIVSGIWEKKLQTSRVLEKVGSLLTAWILAAGFNMIWVLPFVEYSHWSNLSARLGMSENLRWQDLQTWFNPFANGHPLHSHPEIPFSVSDYFTGLPVLVLLLWGLVQRSLRVSTILLWILVVVLSLGKSAYLASGLKGFLPGYLLVVRSGYWMPFVVFLTALLCMQVTERLQETFASNRTWKWSWTMVCAAVWLTAVALGAPWFLCSFWLSLGLVIVGARPGSWRLRMALLCLSLFFSIWPVIQSFNYSQDRSFYEQKPPLAYSLTRPGRIYHSPELVDTARSVSGNGVADIYEKLKTPMIPNWPLAFGLEEAGYSNSLFLMPFLNWYEAPLYQKGADQKSLLDYLDIRYVVGLPPTKGARVLKNVGTFPVWENPQPRPKWFSVSEIVEDDGWARGLADPILSKVSFGRTALSEESSLVGQYSLRNVQETGWTPNSISIRAVGRGRALLVSSEMDFPGWFSQMGPVWDVNRGFRGILLDDGVQDVKLVYRPDSFRLGCFMALAIFGFWTGCFLKMILGRREPLARV